VTSGANDAGQVGPVIDPMGIDRRTCVPDQQDSGVSIGDGLLLRSGRIDRSPSPQTDMTVRVDQARHDPEVAGDSLRATDRFVTDEPVADPNVGRLGIRQDDPGQVPCGHRLLLGWVGHWSGAQPRGQRGPLFC